MPQIIIDKKKIEFRPLNEIINLFSTTYEPYLEGPVIPLQKCFVTEIGNKSALKRIILKHIGYGMLKFLEVMQVQSVLFFGRPEEQQDFMYSRIHALVCFINNKFVAIDLGGVDGTHFKIYNLKEEKVAQIGISSLGVKKGIQENNKKYFDLHNLENSGLLFFPENSLPGGIDITCSLGEPLKYATEVPSYRQFALPFPSNKHCFTLDEFKSFSTHCIAVLSDLPTIFANYKSQYSAFSLDIVTKEYLKHVHELEKNFSEFARHSFNQVNVENQIVENTEKAQDINLARELIEAICVDDQETIQTLLKEPIKEEYIASALDRAFSNQQWNIIEIILKSNMLSLSRHRGLLIRIIKEIILQKKDDLLPSLLLNQQLNGISYELLCENKIPFDFQKDPFFHNLSIGAALVLSCDNNNLDMLSFLLANKKIDVTIGMEKARVLLKIARENDFDENFIEGLLKQYAFTSTFNKILSQTEDKFDWQDLQSFVENKEIWLLKNDKYNYYLQDDTISLISKILVRARHDKNSKIVELVFAKVPKEFYDSIAKNVHKQNKSMSPAQFMVDICQLHHENIFLKQILKIAVEETNYQVIQDLVRNYDVWDESLIREVLVNFDLTKVREHIEFIQWSVTLVNIKDIKNTSLLNRIKELEHLMFGKLFIIYMTKQNHEDAKKLILEQKVWPFDVSDFINTTNTNNIQLIYKWLKESIPKDVPSFAAYYATCIKHIESKLAMRIITSPNNFFSDSSDSSDSKKSNETAFPPTTNK